MGLKHIHRVRHSNLLFSGPSTASTHKGSLAQATLVHTGLPPDVTQVIYLHLPFKARMETEYCRSKHYLHSPGTIPTPSPTRAKWAL